MSSPTLYRRDEHVTVWRGECLDVLRTMPDASVDAIVTDPPYGLSDIGPGRVVDAIGRWVTGDREFVPGGRGFMRARWDSFVPPPAVWDECLRVVRPGGHLLAFAGPRTYDLMGLSVRLAGFEIRDGLASLQAQGFAKSLDVARAVSLTHGATKDPTTRAVPLVAEAEPWMGFGTALKPAFEPVVVARKPLGRPTVAGNVQRYGTGALNIDASRVATMCDDEPAASTGSSEGRWPANVVLVHLPDCRRTGARRVATHSHHPKARGRSGVLSSTGGFGGHDGLVERKSGLETVETWECVPGCPVAELDGQSGGASRFFARFPADDVVPFRFQAKAPAAERPAYRKPDGEMVRHSTVKSLALTRWMVRLVTPPGGVVLDVFAGSGTTGEAALLEGFDSVLVERDADYLPLIDLRLDRARAPERRSA